MLDHIIEVFLIVLIVGLTFGANGFMTWANWMNILRSNSLNGVIAFGMTMVIIAGLIDLSIGSTVALAGVIVARFCRDLTPLGVDLNVACVIGMVVSFLVAIVCWVDSRLGRPSKPGCRPSSSPWPASSGLYGLAGIISGGYPIANQFPDWFNQIGGGRIGGQSGIPIPAIILIVSFLIVLFIMNNTTIGRAVYAVGRQPGIGPPERHQRR